MEYVELNRKFLELTDDSGKTEDQLFESIFSLPQFVKGIGWDDLIGYSCAVILGEAGVGKTLELKKQAKKLLIKGKYAFFLDIGTLIDDEIQYALNAPEDWNRLQEWKGSQELGYFFLDSVDEARLRHSKVLEKTFKKLISEILEQRKRAHFIISCRVSDWQCTMDRNTVDEYLFSGQRNQDEIAQNTSTTRVFQLLPLTLDQVDLMAKSSGIDDSNAFIEEVRKTGSEVFVGRPQDVGWLLDYWASTRSLGNLSEVIEHNIFKKLREMDPDRANEDPLSLEKARQGAELLSATVMFCRMPNILLPDNSFTAGPMESAFNPSSVLKDWTPKEIKSLLRQPIFDEATYGRVRFHHRSVAEYLAAKWMHQCRISGCGIESLVNIFFPEVHGKRTPIPALAPIASWLSHFDNDFRNQSLKIAPEIILFGGDPLQVSVEERKNALCQLYEKRKRLRWRISDAEVRRIGHIDLAEPINQFLDNSNKNQDFVELLLRIIETEALQACSERALRISMDVNQDRHVRYYAFRAIKIIGTLDQMNRLRKYALEQETISNEIIGAMIMALFPSALTISDCLHLVGKAEREISNKQTILPGILSSHLVRLCQPDELFFLLSTMLTLVESEQERPRRKEFLKRRYWWVAGAITSIFLRIIDEFSFSDIQEDLLNNAFIFLQKCKYYQICHLYQIDDLELKLAQSPFWRRKLFWFHVAQVRKKESGYGPIYLLPNTHSLLKLKIEDLNWLLEDIKNNEFSEDRQSGLDAALNIWAWETKRNKDIGKEIFNSIKGNRECERIAQMALFRDPYKQERKRKNLEQKRQTKLDRKKSITLEQNRRIIRQKENEIRLGNNINILHHFWNMCQNDGVENSYTHSVDNLKPIQEKYGADVAEWAREGFIAVWHNWRPPLPYEKKEKHSTEWQVFLGLTGIEIEFQNGLDFKRISPNDADLAVRYALREFEGYPNWISEVIDSQPHTVQSVLKREYFAEFFQTEYNEILPHLQFHPGTLLDFSATILLKLLQTQTPKDIKVMRAVFRIILSNSSFDSNEVLNLILKKHPLLVRRFKTDILLVWLSAWMYVHAESAWDFVEQILVSHYAIITEIWNSDITPLYKLMFCNDIAHLLDSFMVHFASSFAEPFGLSEVELTPDYLTPISIHRMIPALFHHIPPERDIWHEGGFSPGAYDHAQKFRAMIVKVLSETPGIEAFNALNDLANDERLERHKDWFQYLADKQIALDAEKTTWSVEDILRFMDIWEVSPKVPDDLFRIAISRLSDIKVDIESGDFSERDLFSENEPEHHLQKWLANRLEKIAKDQYSVIREEEVDQKKKPDIRLHNSKAGVIGIELKPTDRRYSYTDLSDCLHNQLVGQYLRSVKSRHGILFLAHLINRNWKPAGEGKINAEQLVQKLQDEADLIVRDRPEIEQLQVVAIDFVNPSAL